MPESQTEPKVESVEISDQNREEVIDKIIGMVSEYSRKGVLLEKRIIKLHKSLKRPSSTRKWRKDLAKHDARLENLIKKLNEALDVSEETYDCKSGSTLTLLENMVKDPVQQRKLTMLKQLAEIWKNKAQCQKEPEKCELPALEEIFELLNK